jgi:hypothetical protein
MRRVQVKTYGKNTLRKGLLCSAARVMLGGAAHAQFAPPPVMPGRNVDRKAS